MATLVPAWIGMPCSQSNPLDQDGLGSRRLPASNVDEASLPGHCCSPSQASLPQSCSANTISSSEHCSQSFPEPHQPAMLTRNPRHAAQPAAWQQGPAPLLSATYQPLLPSQLQDKVFRPPAQQLCSRLSCCTVPGFHSLRVFPFKHLVCLMYGGNI